jgi:ABC-type transport system involved in cytochrome c biogenesis permease subunit
LGVVLRDMPYYDYGYIRAGFGAFCALALCVLRWREKEAHAPSSALPPLLALAALSVAASVIGDKPDIARSFAVAGIMGLVAGGLICSVIEQIMSRRGHAGVLILHLGALILIVGAAGDAAFGRQGVLTLDEGQHAKSFHETYAGHAFTTGRILPLPEAMTLREINAQSAFLQLEDGRAQSVKPNAPLRTGTCTVFVADTQRGIFLVNCSWWPVLVAAGFLMIGAGLAGRFMRNSWKAPCPAIKKNTAHAKTWPVILVLLMLWTGTDIGLSWIESGHPPFRTLPETLLLLAFCLSCCGLIGGYMLRAGHYISLPAVFFSGLALTAESVLLWTGTGESAGSLPPILQSPWFVPHVSAYFFGYAFVTIAAYLSAVFLLKGYETCIALTDRVLQGAFLFLTAGLALGSLWAAQAWGSWWSWDPKESMALAGWILLAGGFHTGQNLSGLKIRAWITLAAFAVSLCGYLFMNFMPSAAGSLHIYG